MPSNTGRDDDFFFTWANNPQMQAYVNSNPNGVMASWYNQQTGGTTLGTPPTQYTNTAGGAVSDDLSGLIYGGNNDPNAPVAISTPTQVRPQDVRGWQYRGPDTLMRPRPGNGGLYSFGIPVELPGTHGIAGKPDAYRIGGYGSAAPPTPPNNDGTISFAEGGMMTPQGQAIRPGAGMMPIDEPQLGASAAPKMTPQQIEQEAQRLVRMHPDVIANVKNMLMQGMQSGQLDPNELNLAVQLARATLANPASYPQVRQFAIENGLGTEAEIPQQIDQGLLLALIVAGKALQTNMPTTGAAASQSGATMPSYKHGGMTGDKPHLAKVHPREYVATEKALLYHGKKTYDRLEEQAREAGNGE